MGRGGWEKGKDGGEEESRQGGMEGEGREGTDGEMGREGGRARLASCHPCSVILALAAWSRQPSRQVCLTEPGLVPAWKPEAAGNPI